MDMEIPAVEKHLEGLKDWSGWMTNMVFPKRQSV